MFLCLCAEFILGKSLTTFNSCSNHIDVSLVCKKVLQRGHLPVFQFPLWQVVCFSSNFNSSLIYFWMLCSCSFFPFIFARHGDCSYLTSLLSIIKWTLVLRLGCLLFFAYSRQTERTGIRPIIFQVVLKFCMSFQSEWFSSLLKMIMEHSLITNLYGQCGFFF